MNIFFIDDDDAINRFHQIILEESASKLKLSLSFFDDPIQVMNEFKTKQNFPKIIFLDINMPIMNGWQFLEHYKENNFSKDVIIIILTTSRNPNYEIKANQIELVKEYKTKPLDEKYFESVIEKYC